MTRDRHPPTIIRRVTPSDKKKLPDYEVQTFLDRVCPGMKQVDIAAVAGVHKNSVSNWMKDGMPADQARYLLAWRSLEIIRMSAEIAEIGDEFGL